MSSSLKNLASQTIWYGLSTIVARSISFLQTPIITYLLPDRRGQQAYGEFSVLYSGISLANILFTYGMETAYFRFASDKEDKQKLFRTSFGSLLISTIVLSLIFCLLRQPIADFLELNLHPEYIIWAVLIVAFDTMSAIPFARLRQEGRPKKYAAVRISGVTLNLVMTFFFLYISREMVAARPLSEYAVWYQSHSKAGLLLIPNMMQSILTFLLLWREWSDFKIDIDTKLFRRLWKYASPMILVGLGGMVNETMDRIMLQKLFSGPQSAAKIEVGIYSANYRIAIFISLFVQAFRMSAEPFFFNQAKEKNAPATYAMVMKWFVITLCIAFLFTGLFLDFWQYFVPQSYRSGLHVVPVLLLANICLGIYYNLSAAFKITDNLRQGSYITLFGAAITLFVNFSFVPVYGMTACAWATLLCYAGMMVAAYFRAKKYFHVPYPLATIGRYVLLMGALFCLQYFVINAFTASVLLRLLCAMILFVSFIAYTVYSEREKLRNFPLLKKLF